MDNAWQLMILFHSNAHPLTAFAHWVLRLRRINWTRPWATWAGQWSPTHLLNPVQSYSQITTSRISPTNVSAQLPITWCSAGLLLNDHPDSVTGSPPQAGILLSSPARTKTQQGHSWRCTRRGKHRERTWRSAPEGSYTWMAYARCP